MKPDGAVGVADGDAVELDPSSLQRSLALDAGHVVGIGLERDDPSSRSGFAEPRGVRAIERADVTHDLAPMELEEPEEEPLRIADERSAHRVPFPECDSR